MRSIAAVIYNIPFSPEKPMARKIRELLHDLNAAGFYQIPGGKGSHRKLVHPQYRGAVTLSGKFSADAKPYQERQVRRALEEVQE